MIGLLQRVTEARVDVGGKTIGQIAQGILVLVGVEKGDDASKADRLAKRLITYRVFADDEDKMNLSVSDINGGVLLVPQFTLAADTRKGTRASFTSAAEPAIGKQLFDRLVEQVQQQHSSVATGEFGADMQVSLLNDGPVTFWLQT
ncbi:MAG: D-aminoacyl-tRNA deacylase [Gammaproteobacteria bacterium]|nr:D-aminoacyl-tRNA deacylase [Gammaproteobacteria bacterium]